MSAELIAILTVGVALGATMLATMRGLRVELGDLRSDVGDLRERMARLEGLFEGFTRSGVRRVRQSDAALDNKENGT